MEHEPEKGRTRPAPSARWRLTRGGFSEMTRVLRGPRIPKRPGSFEPGFFHFVLMNFSLGTRVVYIDFSSSIARSQLATSWVKAKVPLRSRSLKTWTPRRPRCLALRKAAALGNPSDFHSASPVRNGPDRSTRCSASLVPDAFEAIFTLVLSGSENRQLACMSRSLRLSKRRN